MGSSGTDGVGNDGLGFEAVVADVFGEGIDWGSAVVVLDFFFLVVARVWTAVGVGLSVALLYSTSALYFLFSSRLFFFSCIALKHLSCSSSA